MYGNIYVRYINSNKIGNIMKGSYFFLQKIPSNFAWSLLTEGLYELWISFSVSFSYKMCILFLEVHSNYISFRGPWPLHFIFQTKQGPTVSVSSIRDVAFYCFFYIAISENYADQKFHNFYRVRYNFWTIYKEFPFSLTNFFKHFFLSVIHHFTLDLLKKSNT